jgi:hypothetical protein
MPIKQPITATPVQSLGFPPRTTFKTAAAVLRRFGLMLTQNDRGEAIAVRIH